MEKRRKAYMRYSLTLLVFLLSITIVYGDQDDQDIPHNE